MLLINPGLSAPDRAACIAHPLPHEHNHPAKCVLCLRHQEQWRVIRPSAKPHAGHHGDLAVFKHRKGVARATKHSAVYALQRGQLASGVRSDLVLSSGYMAFAYHAGFLQAIEEADVHVDGVMGTSSGALAGSLYAAGYSPQQVADELCRLPPIQLLRPCWQPWRGGILSLHLVVKRLQQLLPPTFEELPKKFACGVVARNGQHLLVDRGSLPEAVTASAAVPFLFANVDIPGLANGPFRDGGIADRVGLHIWRERRRQQLDGQSMPPCCIHLVSRSSPFSGTDDVRAAGESGVAVVRSPRSRNGLLSLGNYNRQMEASHLHASRNLQQWQEQRELQRSRQPA